jgi:hypothetical protein
MYMPRSTRTCKSKCQGANAIKTIATIGVKKPNTKQELIAANQALD